MHESLFLVSACGLLQDVDIAFFSIWFSLSLNKGFSAGKGGNIVARVCNDIDPRGSDGNLIST